MCGSCVCWGELAYHIKVKCTMSSYVRQTEEISPAQPPWKENRSGSGDLNKPQAYPWNVSHSYLCQYWYVKFCKKNLHNQWALLMYCPLAKLHHFMMVAHNTSTDPWEPYSGGQPSWSSLWDEQSLETFPVTGRIFCDMNSKNRRFKLVVLTLFWATCWLAAAVFSSFWKSMTVVDDGLVLTLIIAHSTVESRSSVGTNGA